MKTTVFVILTLLTLPYGFAQKLISNQITPSHTQVVGTNFYVIVPEGFIKSNSFQGFQQSASGSSLMFVELPGDVSEILVGFTDEALKGQGIIVKNKETVTVNGKKGIFYTTEQFANNTQYTKYILLFGDSKATYMVNGIFPQLLTQLDAPMRGAIFSVVYAVGKKVNPLEKMAFEIEVKNTKLKFAQNLTGTLLYTVDGNAPTQSTDKTAFMVGISEAIVDKDVNVKEAAISRFKKLPYTNLKMDESKCQEVFIDGMKGYEIVAEGPIKDGVKSGLVYQVLLINEQGYCLMVGTTQTSFEENLAMFQKVSRTFKRK